MPKSKLPYAQAFRDQMVELARGGRPPSDLSKEFGCHITSILSWVRKAGGSATTKLPADVAALNGITGRYRTQKIQLSAPVGGLFQRGAQRAHLVGVHLKVGGHFRGYLLPAKLKKLPIPAPQPSPCHIFLHHSFKP